MNIAENKEYRKKNFIQNHLSFCPNADESVLTFIADFLNHGVPGISLADSNESIRRTFRAGYCYYFAVMLKTAFERGEVCWAAPFGHIVWVDDNNIPYDIEGVYESEYEYLIPVSYLGESLNDFKHIANLSFNASKEFLDSIVERYLKDTKQASITTSKTSAMSL